MSAGPLPPQRLPATAGSTKIDTRFPRQSRVRARAEFDRVFKHGKRTASPALALHWLRDEAPARLGLAISRKVDRRAVGRNRLKRALREQFRSLPLPPGAYVVVARPDAARLPSPQVRAAFISLLQRCGALPRTGVDGTMPATPALPTPPPGTAGP